MSKVVTIIGENIEEKMNYVLQKDDIFFDDGFCYKSENPWDFVGHVTRHILGVWTREYNYRLSDEFMKRDEKYLVVLGAVVIQNIVDIGEYKEEYQEVFDEILHEIANLLTDDEINGRLLEYPEYMPPVSCEYDEWYADNPQRELIDVYFLIDEKVDGKHDLIVKLKDPKKEEEPKDDVVVESKEDNKMKEEIGYAYEPLEVNPVDNEKDILALIDPKYKKQLARLYGIKSFESFLKFTYSQDRYLGLVGKDVTYEQWKEDLMKKAKDEEDKFKDCLPKWIIDKDAIRKIFEEK